MTEKEYWVEAPVTAKMVGTVKASSEQEAIERFMQTQWTCGEITISEGSDTLYMDWDEIQLHEQINQGNVVYRPIGEASAKEVNDA